MHIFEREICIHKKTKPGKENMSKLENFSVALGFLIEITQTFIFS